MPTKEESLQTAQEFYRHALQLLNAHDFPFLVGGGYAQMHYTGIKHIPKDLDLFIRPADCDKALALFSDAGYRTELTDPSWLAKVRHGDDYIDLIFNFSNQVGEITDTWFERSVPATVLDMPVRLVSPEEALWAKAFVLAHDRFDGADIIHLIRALNGDLDWQYLLKLFGDHWRVLLAHLILFGYVFPGEKEKVPLRVMKELTSRLETDLKNRESKDICRGPMFSRMDYLCDTESAALLDR